MSRNIFGEWEEPVVFEFLRCPMGCDYVRSGDRSREKFKCYYCERPLKNDAELEAIDNGTMKMPEPQR